MKKEYKKPRVELFPTKCHVSSLQENAPEEIDGSRRSVLARVGIIATVGHLSLYGGSDGATTASSSTVDTWNGGSKK